MVKKKLEINPNDLYALHSDKLGVTAKSLLVRLAHLQQDLEHAFMTIATLARDIGASPKTTWVALRDLENAGYITRLEREKGRSLETVLNNDKILRDIVRGPIANRNLKWLHKSYGRIAPLVFKGIDIPSNFKQKVELGASKKSK